MSEHRMRLTMSCISSLAFVIATTNVAVSDQVWIEPLRPTSLQSDWYPRAVETHSGSVQQFDNTQLQWMPESGGEPMVFAATRVLWIEPEQLSDVEAESMRLFASGEYSSSLVKLPEILAAKPPIWRQQWITMNAAVAAWKSGRAEIALELVSQLDRRPLPPLVIGWLPIAWTNGPSSPQVIDAAESRLADPSPLVQLVAASWLLASPQRSEALAVLKRLESQDRKEIAKFARILSWRTATPPQVIESSSDWKAAMDSLPMVWQTGPLTMLVDKLRSASQIEAANHLRWSLELTPIHPHYDWMQAPSDTPR